MSIIDIPCRKAARRAAKRLKRACSGSLRIRINGSRQAEDDIIDLLDLDACDAIMTSERPPALWMYDADRQPGRAEADDVRLVLEYATWAAESLELLDA